MWIQIRDIVGTDQRVGTDQGPGIDLSSTYIFLKNSQDVLGGSSIFHIFLETLVLYVLAV